MTMDHSTVIPIVIRFRLRSATPEDPIREERPPPNMSDTPPPRPLCMRIERTSRRHVLRRMTSKTMRRAFTIPHLVRGKGRSGVEDVRYLERGAQQCEGGAPRVGADRSRRPAAAPR